MNFQGITQKPTYFSHVAEEYNSSNNSQDIEEIEELNLFIHRLIEDEYDHCESDVEKIEELIHMQAIFYKVYGKALENNTLKQDISEAYQKITEILKNCKQIVEEKEANLEKLKNEIDAKAKKKFEEIEEQGKKFQERRDAEFFKYLESVEFIDELIGQGVSVGTGSVVAAGGIGAAVITVGAIGLAIPTAGASLAVLFGGSVALAGFAGYGAKELVGRDLNEHRYRYFADAKMYYRNYIDKNPFATTEEAKEFVSKKLKERNLL